MVWKIEFDKEKCIGCRACCSECDNWDFDEEEFKAKPKEIELDELGCNKQAEEICPVEAIKIIESE